MTFKALALDRSTAFFKWFGRTVDTLCERPDHLQRLAIIGAGMFVYPMIWAFVLIVWLGFGHGQPVEVVLKQLNFIGYGMIGTLLLWGLVVVTLLGTIKGVRISGPGGFNAEFETSAGDGKGLAHPAAPVIAAPSIFQDQTYPQEGVLPSTPTDLQTDAGTITP